MSLHTAHHPISLAHMGIKMCYFASNMRVIFKEMTLFLTIRGSCMPPEAHLTILIYERIVLEHSSSNECLLFTKDQHVFRADLLSNICYFAWNLRVLFIEMTLCSLQRGSDIPIADLQSFLYSQGWLWNIQGAIYGCFSHCTSSHVSCWSGPENVLFCINMRVCFR